MTWHLAITIHVYFIFVGLSKVQIKKLRNKAYWVTARNGKMKNQKSYVASLQVDIILLSLHFSKCTIRLKHY